MNRIILILCFFALCNPNPAFTQKVLSLHPLFSEQDAILVPQISGSWNSKDFHGYSLTISKAGDNFYFLNSVDANKPSFFEAVIVRLGNDFLLDISPCSQIPDTLGDRDYSESFIRAHSFYKISIGDDTLKISGLDYAWFYKQIEKQKSPLSHQWLDNILLLTMSTGEINSFFTEHSKETEIFTGEISFSRESYPVNQEKIVSQVTPESKDSQSDLRKCIPEFPLKDGWLGGDGDVSIPVNATQTLFIFSDTYVGNKNQDRSCEGLKMVSNSVAVETCLPGIKPEVHYFWNKMYTDNPGPIFKSFTNRYRYWVNDAFRHKNCLYVLLEKIAAKQGGAPDDIFNFSQVGYTLAKIVNHSDTPDKWRIELIPLPDFSHPLLGIGAHAKDNNFLYFFVNRNDNAQLLARKNLDFIDAPEKSFEYYALNKTWKSRIQKDDMDTLIHGFRANTVNYHPDMKQWVMVCDIKFLDNKIRIRTASNLTGPWSDEKIIYECPEVTPGNAAYSKTNFCYLPRECIQNYDGKNHSMLITYDINNSDFSEIRSNPQIYTPKVVSISLEKPGNQ
jgi:hypothetical protein